MQIWTLRVQQQRTKRVKLTRIYHHRHRFKSNSVVHTLHYGGLWFYSLPVDRGRRPDIRVQSCAEWKTVPLIHQAFIYRPGSVFMQKRNVVGLCCPPRLTTARGILDIGTHRLHSRAKCAFMNLSSLPCTYPFHLNCTSLSLSVYSPTQH